MNPPNLTKRASVLRSQRRSIQAFTLIEILAACAVLMLILLLLLQISASTLGSTRATRQQIESIQQNRAALDAIGRDLDCLAVPGPASIYVTTVNGNAQLSFLTRGRAPGGFGDNRLLAVKYRVRNFTLERVVANVSWSERNLVSVLTGTPSPSESVSIVAENILRLEVAVQLEDGTLESYLSAPKNSEGGMMLASRSGTASLDKIGSIIVAVASIDGQTMDLITKLNKRDTTISALGQIASPSPGITPVDLWREALSGNLGDALPGPALNSLRFNQKVFSVGRP